MIIFYIIALLTGALVKIVDQIEDVLGGTRRTWKYMLAIFYGLLMGYTIAFASFSTIWIGAILAQFAAGRIDQKSHLIAFIIAFVFAAIFGVREFDLLTFFIFFVFAAFDEFNIFEAPIRDLRLTLKFASLIYGLFIGRWDYFIAIMLFDIAYYIVGKVFPYAFEKERSNYSCIHEKIN